VNLAPFVPSPPEVIIKMLQASSIQDGEKLYDIGSGNGAILIMAARDFGARCVGIEIRKDLADKSADNIKINNVEDRIKVLNSDIFNIDISDADIVTLYLTSSGNLKLKEKLEKELKKEARIVSHDFEITGWVPSKVIKGDPPGHTIYLYHR